MVSVHVVYHFATLLFQKAFSCENWAHQTKYDENHASATNGSVIIDFLLNSKNLHNETASTFQPTTDKVTTHTYQIMYGKFLSPHYYQNPNRSWLILRSIF